MQNINKNVKTAGIYIHIPFCKIKCIYCDFYSITEREEQIDKFTNMLCREISQFSEKNDFQFTIDTIFFGGGTPSLLEPKHLNLIICKLNDIYNLDDLYEITLEANPGEAPLNKLRSFFDLGINRLSMGFQSLQPDLLKFLTRIHSKEDALNTFTHARKAGFNNINIDMIFSIPGQTMDKWKSDLNMLIDLSPNHISAYSLTNEPGTEFNKMVKAGKIIEVDDNIDLKYLEFTRQHLSVNGYNPYEISNFSHTGFECRHNLHYWNSDPYLAFGPSAHGFDGSHRWWNVRSIDEYIKRLDNNHSPIVKKEKINNEMGFNELLLNGLRLKYGVDIKRLIHYRSDTNDILSKSINKWKNKLENRKGRLVITKEGIPLTDSILADLFI